MHLKLIKCFIILEPTTTTTGPGYISTTVQVVASQGNQLQQQPQSLMPQAPPYLQSPSSMDIPMTR